MLLKAEELSDYKIAIKLKMDIPTVQSGKNALNSKSDLDFAGKLKAKRPHYPFLSYRDKMANYAKHSHKSYL